MASDSHSTDATPDSPLAEQPSCVRGMVFSLACGTSFFLYLHRYTWNIIAPQLKKEYGFNETQLGALGSFFNWTYGICQIPSGIFCDFIGPHLFLGIIIVVWSLILPIFGLTGNYYGLAAVRLLFGIGQAGAYPSLSKVTQSWFPQRSRTIVQGFVATFFGRGGGAMSSILMATILMGWLELSWRVSLMIMGGMGVLFGILFLILFRNSPEVDTRTNQAERDLIDEDRIPHSDDAPRVLPWRRVIKNRSMMFFVIQQMSSAGADTVYSLFMGSYFLFAKGIDIAQAGLLISLPLFGGAIGGMLGGYCNDWLIRWTGSRRWGRCIVGFTGKFLACLLMFVAIAQDDATTAGWALFVVKFFSDWSQPTVWGTCTDLGGRYSATVFSIINTSGTIGGIVVPVAFGAILDWTATPQIVNGQEQMVGNYGAMFTAVAILYIISAVAWFFIDSTTSLEHEMEPAK